MNHLHTIRRRERQRRELRNTFDLALVAVNIVLWIWVMALLIDVLGG